MGYQILYIQMIIIQVIIQSTEEVKFMRTIQAIGLPYYKILLTLGYCKDHIIFKEQKSWPAVKLNRIMDIYYKSSNDRIKVSRVEITLIINNTNCLAFSETGVGHNEFTASILYSTHIGLMFYGLILYTCDKYTLSITPGEDPQLPFYVKNVHEDKKNENDK